MFFTKHANPILITPCLMTDASFCSTQTTGLKYTPKLSTYYKGEVQTIDINTTHAEWFNPRQIKLIIQQIQKHL